ncbi:hypothetical protein AABB24_017196 [Solanum stoloniferum]|uniref:Uncharacterized protein n=1 Tax=Solanum stoloniferum TaxID=62892 RepID=A0ABD2TJA8_9SOLN
MLSLSEDHFFTMQVIRISIQHAVDPAEHSRVSGEPLLVPEDSVILFSFFYFIRMLWGLSQHPSQCYRDFIDSQTVSIESLIYVFTYFLFLRHELPFRPDFII